MASTSIHVFVENESPVGGVGPTHFSMAPATVTACVARIPVFESVAAAVTVVLEKMAPTGQSWQINAVAKV